MDKELILITGGAGYIGSHVSRALLESGKSILVIDDLSTGHEEVINLYASVYGSKKFLFEKVDLLDEKKLNAVLGRIKKEYKIKGIIDFAARIAVGESQVKPWEYFRVNVAGFRNLIMATGSIPIVKSSTAAVYGTPQPKDMPLKEELLDVIVKEKRFKESQLQQATVTFGGLLKWYEKEVTSNYSFMKLGDEDVRYLMIQNNVYGITKMMDEIMLKKLNNKTGRKYVPLRYFNAAGADACGLIGEDHRPETHLVPLILKAALGKVKEITVFGDNYDTKDGTCIRDYVSVSDLASAHILALKYLWGKGKSRPFNVGSNLGYTVNEVIDISKKITGRKIPVVMGPRREGDSIMLVASDSLTKKELGWKRLNGIEDIVSSAWHWHSLNPDGYRMLREQRYSPYWGKWINVVSSRSLRPWSGEEEKIRDEEKRSYNVNCYLCPGNKRVSGRKNPKYKDVFVFENDFPTFMLNSPFTKASEEPYRTRDANGICEVLVYSPKHNDRFAKMPEQKISKIINLWIDTYERLGKRKDINYVLIFENRGEVMGNSQLHPHGQVYASSCVPDLIVSHQLKEFASYRKRTGRCFVCDSLKAEKKDRRRILAENRSFIAFIPFAPTVPYETMIIPKRHLKNISVLKKEE